jgi:hypothetical protein
MMLPIKLYSQFSIISLLCTIQYCLLFPLCLFTVVFPLVVTMSTLEELDNDSAKYKNANLKQVFMYIYISK